MIIERFDYSRTDPDLTILSITRPVPDRSFFDLEQNFALSLVLADPLNDIQIAREDVIVNAKSECLEHRKLADAYHDAYYMLREIVGFDQRSSRISRDVWKVKVEPAKGITATTRPSQQVRTPARRTTQTHCLRNPGTIDKEFPYGNKSRSFDRKNRFQ